MEGQPVWRLEVTGAPGTLYQGETYTLKVDLGSRYPYDSPEVTFEGKAPIHPHIYENGHICLSILDKEWYGSADCARPRRGRTTTVSPRKHNCIAWF